MRPYSLARPRGAFLAAELSLLAVALLQRGWSGHSFGALVLIASCTLFFHINSLDRSLVSSESSQFSIDLLESLTLGFLLSALLFHLFPGLVPRVDMAVGAGVLVGLLPVSLRFFLRHQVTRGKCVEEILIIGTGDLPAKLHRALGRGVGASKRNSQMPGLSGNLAHRRGAVDLAELNELVVRDQISRVVIAELDAQSRERVAAALLDSRLRGLQVSDAVDFYETISGKIWVEALNPRVVRIYERFQAFPSWHLSEAVLRCGVRAGADSGSLAVIPADCDRHQARVGGARALPAGPGRFGWKAFRHLQVPLHVSRCGT